MKFNLVFKAVFLFSLISTAFIISCGGQKDLRSVERPPGTDGMTVIESDGIILEIPQGALDDGNLIDDITLNTISDSELPIRLPEGFSLLFGFELKPDGIVFNNPVTITI